MRRPTPLAAVIAGGLLHRASAQSTGYGPPDGSTDDAPYGPPGSNTDAGPVGTVAGFPPTAPTCAMEGTTTVFVTIYPTGQPTIASDGSLPQGPTPDQTIFKTLHPTKTIMLSPVPAPSLLQTQSSVEPFTTITIDIWGAATHPGDGSESALSVSADAPVNSGPIIASGESPVTVPTVYAASAQDPQGNPVVTAVPQEAPYGSASAAGVITGSGAEGQGGASSWYTIVTDSDVHWVPGSAGPSQVTILSPHTITFGAAPTGPPGASSSPTCVTVLGPDGQPTVIDASGNIMQGTEAPAVVSSATFAGDNEAGSTTCTSYTVMGADGVPTVIESTWVVSPVVSTPAPEDFPTNAVLPFATATGITNGAGSTTCTSYTVMGADGVATVVESTWVVDGPMNTQTALPTAQPSEMYGQTTATPGMPYPTASGAVGVAGEVTTSATYTFLGPDGLPTAVETTYVVSAPVVTPFSGSLPAGQFTDYPLSLSQMGSADAEAMTTCITYALLGTDGLLTVVESTVVLPANTALPTQSNIGFPSAASQETQDQLPQGIPPFTSSNGAVTTCITVDVLGTDGVAIPVVETVVLPSQTAGAGIVTAASLGSPSMIPGGAWTDLPQGVSPTASANGAVTTCITVDVLGPDGIETPVVQTVILPPYTSIAALPVSNSELRNMPLSGVNGYGGLQGYGTPVADSLQTAIPPASLVTGLGSLAQETTGPISSALAVVTAPNGVPVVSGPSVLALPPYDDTWDSAVAVDGYGAVPTDSGAWASSALYGPVPSATTPMVPDFPYTTTALQTSTWTNIIPEQTTTYTLKFPLSTLTTITISAPVSLAKRVLRRQQSSMATGSTWSNSSTASTTSLSESVSASATLSSIFSGESTLSIPQPPIPTPQPTGTNATSTVSGPSIPTVCAAGGDVGNFTLNFDDIVSGPLFNPAGDMWFSEGFLVAPPSSQQSEPYVPSSGGRLVEFVPPSLSSSPTDGTRDTAEVGIGPNFANPCFRFNLYGADLGCAAQGSEQWCEFDVSAYSFDEASGHEQAISVSETKRVPACPSFPSGSCALTPVNFDGYTNITSVLITAHVGLDLRVWWGDDFQMGWTDSTCEAASCRGGAVRHRVKRETVQSALRRGVWRWTPSGLEQLDDAYLWGAVH